MMNLEKRVKRHIIAQRHHFFAACAPGFENLCRRELEALSETLTAQTTTRGGVLFSGRMSDLYLANLHVRTGARILMRIGAFSATNFRKLAKQIQDLAWELYLPPGTVPLCKSTTYRSRLYHTQAIDECVGTSVAARWQALDVPIQGPLDQTLHVRIAQDTVTLSLDSSGANLYQRGIKTHHTAAPLRETLAAGILMLAGYRPEHPLLDPMCGSGTFSLEAALAAKGIPPGWYRAFAFMQWPCFRDAQWHHIRSQAAARMPASGWGPIMASDQNTEYCRQLTDCITANHLDDAVTVTCRDFFDLQRPDLPFPPGLVVLNPPYGRRLTADDPTRAFYKRIGGHLQRIFCGWQAALIVPHPDFANLMPFAVSPHTLIHGGLQLTLLMGTIPPFAPKI